MPVLISWKSRKAGIGGGSYAQTDERWPQSAFPDKTELETFVMSDISDNLCEYNGIGSKSSIISITN